MFCSTASRIKPQSGQPADADAGNILASFMWSMPRGDDLLTCSHHCGRWSSSAIRFGTLILLQFGQSDMLTWVGQV